MKILFVSASPINKSVSIGNTFLNVFENVPDVEFASVFTKNGLPDVSIRKAFRITEKMIIKRLFLQSKTVGTEEQERYQGESVADNKAVRFAKKNRWSVFFWIQNLIWSFPIWKSKQLRQFLLEYQPDVIFTVLSDSGPLNRLARYITKYTRKPLMVYAWDDNYTVKSAGKSLFKILGRLSSRRSMRKTVKVASNLYVISNIQKGDYEAWFKKECKLLTKSADFSVAPVLKHEYGKPLQLVYTGNIGMNRWKSLQLIVQALQRLNKDGEKAFLRIYTGNYYDEALKAALNVENCSRIIGSVSAEEVKTLQEEADILVHVESLEKADYAKLRQSFSTKLVDYFKSARPILAVGPDGVASMEHLKENECAMTAQDVESIYQHLISLIENPELLNAFSLKAYECGRIYHNRNVMSTVLLEDLKAVIKE